MIGLRNTWKADARCLQIGLVNNMPDAALEATERQFQTLLWEAAEGIRIEFSLFAIPEVSRSDNARRRISASYSSLQALWNGRFDGLIVTGAEPITPELTHESYWGTLRELVDWAQRNTISSIWSCLAAHAAVLKLDGIRRYRLSDKLFGVFECSSKISENPLMTGMPCRHRTPHSRCNDLSESVLSDYGYHVLTRLRNGGVDTFVKQANSLFVFCQGHPEYEAASLLLEYRRDVRRFLTGERNSYPTMPQDYFDQDAAAAWMALRIKALSNRSEGALDDFPAVYVRSSWRREAVQFYGNWLQYLFEEKARRVHSQAKRIDYKSDLAVTAAYSHLA